MAKNKLSILSFLVVTLFFVTPFIMSYEDVENAQLTLANTLPTYISTISSWYRWGCLFILAAFFFFNFPKKADLKISTPLYFLSFFYFVQFLYALIDGIDYGRFFLLSIFSLLIPPMIGLCIRRNKNVIKYFLYSILFFLIVSIILNGHTVLMGKRFFGFMNNPNIYGLSTVFWLVILIISERITQVRKRFFIILFVGILLTMLFSGSRNAMVGILIVLSVNYYNQFRKVLLGFGLLLTIFFITSYVLDLSVVTTRLQNISDAVSDSGREDIWRRAFGAINQHFWWGNGMDANMRIADTGNMHNCYLRFVLNMGIFFTVLSTSMYFIALLNTYANRNKVPLILTGFLCAFALMNLGEDFFVGLGSAAYVYLLFIFGFINYFITDSDFSRR